MSSPTVTLIGDRIENPANASALVDAAALFGAGFGLHNPAHAIKSVGAGFPDLARMPTIDEEQIQSLLPMVALENAPRSASLFGVALPPATYRSLVVGGEARGVSHRILQIVARTMHIPVSSRTINTLNVAAAAAVGLYAVSRGGLPASPPRSNPDARRPELLILGGGDEFELGSTIRSAAALGWKRVFLQDRSEVWFSGERRKREGANAAARSSRNGIRVIPAVAGGEVHFKHIQVLTSGTGDDSLHRSRLAGGPDTLLVLIDEVKAEAEHERWAAFGDRVSFIDIPGTNSNAPFHLRLNGSIFLAEASRQIGQRVKGPGAPRKRRGLLYESAIRLGDPVGGVNITVGDLEQYL